MTATLRSPFNLSAHLRPTVGDQKITFVGVDHMGWLLCDGRSLSTTDYGLLFGVIGYTFDTSLIGTTSFKLPDFRGTVPGMAGAQSAFSGASNPTTYVIGDKVGEQLHVLTIGEMPAHTHGSSNASGSSNGNGFTTSNGLHNHSATIDSNGTHSHNILTANAGATVENRVGQAIDNVSEGPATTEPAGNHSHTFTINSNGNHNHQIFNTGGDQYHNNMQPTLFGGNMFII